MSWFQAPSLPSLCHCLPQLSQPRLFSGAERSRIRVLTRSDSQAPLGLPISERDACVRPGPTLLAGPDAELAGEGRGALASSRRPVNFLSLIPIGHCYPKGGRSREGENAQVFLLLSGSLSRCLTRLLWWTGLSCSEQGGLS